MKSKRGQGLPLNTIVIAAIVLIVLVVLVMIFTGSMGGFVKGLKKDCAADLKGVCDDFKCTNNPDRIPITGTSCEILNKDKEGEVILQSGQKKDATGKIITPYCCIAK